MENNLEKIINKINQMIKLAKNSDKPGEVEAAQRMAQRLITKYQIEDAQLNGHLSSDDVIAMRVDTPKPYRLDKSMLLNAIAKHNFCKVLRDDDYCMIYGYANDIEICLALYDTLLVHMINEMNNKLERAKDQSFGSFNTKGWIKAFFAGYAVGLSERIKESRQDTIKEASLANKSVELVVRDKQHAVEKYFQSIGRKPAAKLTVLSSDGYREGKISGKQADISQTTIGKEDNE